MTGLVLKIDTVTDRTVLRLNLQIWFDRTPARDLLLHYAAIGVHPLRPFGHLVSVSNFLRHVFEEIATASGYSHGRHPQIRCARVRFGRTYFARRLAKTRFPEETQVHTVSLRACS